MIRRVLGANLLKAGSASAWIVVGRSLGLAWTTALIVNVGISDYGLYAMAFSFAAIIAAPLDNPFLVRSLRNSDAMHDSERAARALLGTCLLAAGCLLYAQFFALGFGLIVAGGEIAFNAFKSQSLRDGHPNIVMRWDVYRQAAAVGSGALAMWMLPDHSLESYCLAYLAPYVPVLLVSLVSVRGFRPAWPGKFREWILLWTDALIVALHIQGDILLLGLLTNNTVVGYYSVASIVVLAVASFAQMHVHTFHEALRAAGGHPSAGPGPRSIAAIAGVFAIMVGGAGWVLSITGLAPEVATPLMILGAFTAVRCVVMVMTTILYVQGRDRDRVLGGGVAVIIKLVLITVLAPFGAAGAAVAASVAEAVLAVWYVRAVHRNLGLLSPLRSTPESKKEHVP